MNKFSRVYIEITNVCNLSCSFCIGNTRPARFMSSHEFKEIIHQVKPYTSCVCLHILGEPLMHPELAEILRIAHSASIKVNLTTNGTLLGAKRDILLSAPALRKVSISLHSMEPGSPHSPDSYLAEIAAFSAEAAKSGLICDLRLWNLGAAVNENESVLHRLCSLFGAEGEDEAAVKIRESGSVTLAPKIFLGTALRFDWPDMNAPITGTAVFCHGMRTHVGILCDGTVVPCCLDSRGDIALGNVFQNPFTAIIQSPRAKKLYDGFSARIPSEELCRRCGYATRF